MFRDEETNVLGLGVASNGVCQERKCDEQSAKSHSRPHAGHPSSAGTHRSTILFCHSVRDGGEDCQQGKDWGFSALSPF